MFTSAQVYNSLTTGYWAFVEWIKRGNNIEGILFLVLCLLAFMLPTLLDRYTRGWEDHSPQERKRRGRNLMRVALAMGLAIPILGVLHGNIHMIIMGVLFSAFIVWVGHRLKEPPANQDAAKETDDAANDNK